MTGWIRLHRQLLEWEWYSCTNTTRVFVHLLLTASWKDARWQGVEIPRGSVFASPDTLANATKLTRQQIRTIITRLKSTSEITTRATNKGTLITLCNFDTYNPPEDSINQRINQRDNQTATSDQPALNHILRREEGKKERSIIGDSKESPPSSGPAIAWTQAEGFQGITDADKQSWAIAYPACDLTRQLAAMNEWLRANPTKAHKKAWRRFITGWLERAQERGGDAKSAQVTSFQKKTTINDYDRPSTWTEEQNAI